MPDSRTSGLIFSVPELIDCLSSICTLVPRDLIFTGTPSRVGATRGCMLKDGNVIESDAEVIGSLVNHCVG
jgi:2,4-diketo-3-deoxy-L-fuconate hydrolase